MGLDPTTTDKDGDGVGISFTQEVGQGAGVGVGCATFIFTLYKVQQKWAAGGGAVMVPPLHLIPEAILAILVYFIF